MFKPEDLKVLKRSPDLNNVQINRLIIRLNMNIFGFTIYGHGGHFGQVTYIFVYYMISAQTVIEK